MSWPRRFKVAVVGLGKMGRNHLRVLKDHGGFEICALVDPKAETESLAQHGTKWFMSVDEMLKSQLQLDVVVVASSTKSHVTVSSALLSLRVPLLVEKPLAHTAKDAKALAKTATDKGIAIFVGHTERCNPAVRKLKRIIDSHIIGQPIHYSTTRVGGFPKLSERSETNVLLDLAVHDLDVLSVLAGPMKLRSSICHSTLDNKYSDTAHLLLTGDTGCSASLHVNWITPTKIRNIHVTGSSGVARVDYIMQTCNVIGGNIIKRNERGNFTYADVISDYMSSDQIEFGVTKKEPLMVQAEELHGFLSTGVCSLCTANEAAQTVHLAESAITFGQGGVGV